MGKKLHEHYPHTANLQKGHSATVISIRRVLISFAIAKRNDAMQEMLAWAVHKHRRAVAPNTFISRVKALALVRLPHNIILDIKIIAYAKSTCRRTSHR